MHLILSLEDEIIELYVQQGLGLRKTAKILNISTYHIRKILKERGIPLKKSSKQKGIKNLRNQKFGKWLVLDKDPHKKYLNGRLTIQWYAECECGTKRWVDSRNMMNGHSHSCGCHFDPKKCNGPNYLSYSCYRNIVNRAKKRGMEFHLSLEYLRNLYEKQNYKCILSGVDIGFWDTDFKNFDKSHKMTASLDRIDSNLGYIEGNVQWVHKFINKMKLNHSQENFIQFCNQIAKMHPR